MGIAYGYVWGLWWWRTTHTGILTDSLRSNHCNLPTNGIGIRALKARGLSSMYQSGLARGIPNSLPIDVVQAGSPPNVSSPAIVLHRWNGFIPMWTLCVTDAASHSTASPDLLCSPEFCLVQIASIMHTIIREQTDPWQHIVILAELGCELCGTYSKDNTPRGFRNRAQSLTTTSNIALFVKRLAHEPGASKLFSAFTWIIDGLHSPMETVLYLMLCLPKWYGGLEFPMPYANSKLDVPQALYPKTRLRHIYPDLFWPEASLIVEYDSEEVHNGREKEDQERQELAQDMGYKVVTFRLSDLKDAKRFEAKARSVAQHLGHALPPTTDKHRALSAKLRNMLIFHERWI